MNSTNTVVFIKWQDSEFSLGIKTIDDHHRVLVDLINEMYLAFMERKHSDITAQVLDRLEEYAAFHFSYEERVFSQVGYASRTEHIHHHRSFADKIGIFKAQSSAGLDATFSIINFLRDWLKTHIQVEDKKYVASFVKAGIC